MRKSETGGGEGEGEQISLAVDGIYRLDCEEMKGKLDKEEEAKVGINRENIIIIKI